MWGIESLFFGFLNGLLLTREIFAARVQKAFRKLGVEMEKYTGHSFCISAATKTAAVGVEDSLIQTLRKWKSAAYVFGICSGAKGAISSVSGAIAKLWTSFVWSWFCEYTLM